MYEILFMKLFTSVKISMIWVEFSMSFSVLYHVEEM